MAGQGFPNLTAPLTDPGTGIVTTAWRQFFTNLWNRTGGSSGAGGGGFATGDLKPWIAPTLPADGWLLADGSAVSRTTYAGLFGVIGTTWGAGDGSSTFALPDLRGRALLGAGTGHGLSPRSLGQAGGAETFNIGVANLPAHTHPIADPGHSHGVTDPGHSHTALVGAANVTAGSGTGGSAAGSTGSALTGITGTQTASTGITATGANTGGGTPLPTLPPFAVVNWIIKT
jgi:microcystin-dependent protein